MNISGCYTALLWVSSKLFIRTAEGCSSRRSSHSGGKWSQDTGLNGGGLLSLISHLPCVLFIGIGIASPAISGISLILECIATRNSTNATSEVEPERKPVRPLQVYALSREPQ